MVQLPLISEQMEELKADLARKDDLLKVPKHCISQGVLVIHKQAASMIQPKMIQPKMIQPKMIQPKMIRKVLETNVR